MRNLEIAYILAVFEASQLLWLRHIAFLHFQMCFPLLSSPLLFSPFFFFFEYALISHNRLMNAAYNIIIHRNESATLCHKGALDVLKYLTSDGKSPSNQIGIAVYVTLLSDLQYLIRSQSPLIFFLLLRI